MATDGAKFPGISLEMPPQGLEQLKESEEKQHFFHSVPPTIPPSLSSEDELSLIWNKLDDVARIDLLAVARELSSRSLS